MSEIAIAGNCSASAGLLFGRIRKASTWARNAAFVCTADRLIGCAKQDSRWQCGQSGNPTARPRGTRNKVTLAAKALLDAEARSHYRIGYRIGQ